MLSVIQRGRLGAPRTSLLKISLLLCIGILLFAVHTIAAELMLPQIYTQQVDVSGWLMSEKLDGVRGYWDGKQLLSKNGHAFPHRQHLFVTCHPFLSKASSGAGVVLLSRPRQSS